MLAKAALLIFAAAVAAVCASLLLNPPGSGGATGAATPRIVPTGDPTPTAPVSLEAARQLMASGEPLVISVLGDSTGNESHEWVALWAEHHAQARAVELHVYDDATGTWGDPEVLSTSGAPLTIWNMSSPGRKADYPADKINLAQPTQPDLVIYNFGHNNTSSNIENALWTTNQAVEAKWGGPVLSVIVLQNPSTTERAEQQAATVQKLRDGVAPWLGFATLDVHSAFLDADEPLSELLGDGTHPSILGGRIWAEAVIDQLG